MALPTTSEPRAVDRHAVVLGLVLSVADFTTSEGAGASTQPVTIAEGVSYNDAGGVCCRASLRLAPPVLSEHAAIERASRGRRTRPGGINFFRWKEQPCRLAEGLRQLAPTGGQPQPVLVVS